MLYFFFSLFFFLNICFIRELDIFIRLSLSVKMSSFCLLLKSESFAKWIGAPADGVSISFL